MIVMMMKLALALLFGLLIGLDRQMKQKQLGMRPSMVICIASCLLTIVSIEAFGKFRAQIIRIWINAAGRPDC